MSQTVVYFTDSPAFGGSEQAILILLAGLDRQRWNPVLIHHAEPGLAPLVAGARQLGVRTWAAPRMRGRHGSLYVPGFVRALRALRPAVFHAHLVQPLACTYPRLSAILARIPAIVATEHLFVGLPWPRSVRLEQVLARWIDRYIAVSHDVARHLRAALGFPPHKLQVVHNGIPLPPSPPAPDSTLRAGLQGGTERPIVLTVARLHPQKGLNYLLEAATQIPEAMFALAGDGPERAALEAQVAALGLGERVAFLGHRTDIPALLASCDLFVLPSLFEGLPLSVLEAMAAGKPVIATAVGGTAEAVSHGKTGLLVPAGDAGALAAAIRILLSNPPLATHLGQAGLASAQREFSAATMVQRVTAIYDDILGAGTHQYGCR